MREPSFDLDGWCLEDGEQMHADAPDTFFIPNLEDRQALQFVDFAKLVFRISVGNVEEPVSIERMWVVVRERVPDGYFGILDNEPDAIEENDDLWSGIELPFSAHHIIAILRC